MLPIRRGRPSRHDPLPRGFMASAQKRVVCATGCCGFTVRYMFNRLWSFMMEKPFFQLSGQRCVANRSSYMRSLRVLTTTTMVLIVCAPLVHARGRPSILRSPFGQLMSCKYGSFQLSPEAAPHLDNDTDAPYRITFASVRWENATNEIVQIGCNGGIPEY